MQTLNAALEQMDAAANAADGAVAEGEERLMWARMLVYETVLLEWVTCRLTLTRTTMVCAIAGQGEGRGRTELALGETEVVEEEVEIEVPKEGGYFGQTEKKMKMVPMVRDKGAEVSIEVLPDHARRSKHSRLATFSVTAGGKTLLLAAAGHAEMWEWARAVSKWRIPGLSRVLECFRTQTTAAGPCITPLFLCILFPTLGSG